jgi:hypothetical protein
MVLEKRFVGKDARWRYKREYKENRMFNSYLDSNYDFYDDIARQNGYKSWVMRHNRFTGWVHEAGAEKFWLLMVHRHPELIIPF